MMNPYTIKKQRDSIVVTFTDVNAGFEQWILCRGDAHFDSASSNNALEMKHLKMAQERGALIVDIGDLFDAMQGTHDRRRRFGASIQDVEMDDYFDVLTEKAYLRYAPFAENWLLLGMGNHEDSVLHHAQTNLTRRLAHKLHAAGSQVIAGGLEGWLRFRFSQDNDSRHSCGYFDCYYLHGYGGGGPVTKGAIQANRRQTWINADFVVSGHTHQSFHLPYRRLRLNKMGGEESRRTDHIQVSGYKERDNWNKSRGHSPECRTAFWIRFYGNGSQVKRQVIEVEE